MYIHLMEMSARPEDALRAADRLRDLVPDAGHLRHMPTHLDVLCGDYSRVVSANTAAIEADEKFLALRGAMNFYTLYRAHNYHFKIYGAMFLGQAKTALDAADQLAAAIPEELLRVQVPPMADWLEGFVPMKMHVLIRFGRWAGDHRRTAARGPGPVLRDHGDAPLRQGRRLRGQRPASARPSRAAARCSRPRRPRARLALPVQQHLPGHPADRRRPCWTANWSTGRGTSTPPSRQLRRAVELDDGLPYDEPWGWMQPTRHAYGALLLEQGRVTEAEAVYRADLGLDGTPAAACQHPGNVWSLHGYHECLIRLGKHEQAGIIGQQLEIAAARADVPVRSSCYCRLTPAAIP